VYTRGGGRLGNQLLNYVNLLAFQREHPEFNVLNLAFSRYEEMYTKRHLPLSNIADLVPDGLIGWLIRAFWGDNPLGSVAHYDPLDRIRHQVLHFTADQGRHSRSLIGGNTHATYRLPGEHVTAVNLSTAETVGQLQSVRTTLLAGWSVRAWSLIERHQAAIRDALQPDEQYISAAKSFIADIRSEYDTLVGVLIRQGDYRSFRNGEFFFESARYRELMDQYARESFSGKVAFVIASPESQPTEVFAEDRFRFCSGDPFGPNHFLENFAELSLCDVILTPPSTFSMISAFLGDIPIVPLHQNIHTSGWVTLDRPLLDSLSHPEMATVLE